MHTVGENHQSFGKLASGGTEKVDSVSPASSKVRLEAGRLSNVEPAKSALNLALAAPQSEVSEKMPITLEEINKQFEHLLNKKDSKKVVCQNTKENSGEISLAAITPDNSHFIKIIVGGRHY